MEDRKLFLDDIRDPFDPSWDVQRTSKDFKKYIEDLYQKEKKVPHIVSFDHDLHKEHYLNEMYGDPEAYNTHYKRFKHDTGLDCAKWLCEFCVEKGLALPQINVHSMNPVGAQNICHLVMNYSLFYFEEEVQINPRAYHQGPPKQQV